MVKGVFLTVAVVLGSLLTAGFLHPEDHIGDRCAVLFIAFLILVTNMQTDLGLGRLSYLLWLDVFNLIQLLLVLVCCAETIFVHNLLKRHRDEIATHLDKASRIIFPLLVYPVITGGTLLAFVDATMGRAICAAGVPACMLVLALWVNRKKRKARLWQLQALENLKKTDVTDEQVLCPCLHPGSISVAHSMPGHCL